MRHATWNIFQLFKLQLYYKISGYKIISFVNFASKAIESAAVSIEIP